MNKLLLVLGATLLAAAGCREGFDPFNKVDKLRVLAIQAEPPSVLSGEQSELSALVYHPDDAPISYRWSWCPVTLGALAGYECAVDEQEIRQAMEDAFPGSSALLPSFDLGTQSTAEFELNIPPQAISALCESDFETPGFDVDQLFSCDGDLTFTVTLEVEAAGEQVTAVKEIVLLTEDDDGRNENPSIGRVEIEGDGATVLPADSAATLAPEKWYDLLVDIPGSSAQTFTPLPNDEEPNPQPEKERLFMTWFVTGEETEFQRTTFIDGEVPFDTLESNSWKTPSLEDAPTGSARLFLVLQDQRGGVAWTTRLVELEER